MMEFRTIDCRHMNAIVKAVSQAEHKSNYKASTAVSEFLRTASQEQDTKVWSEYYREWALKHKDFLDIISMDNKMFVEAVFVDFENILDLRVNQDILWLFNTDAANVKHELYFLNIFAVIGFNLNIKIFPLMYLYILGNVFNESWRSVIKKVKQRFPEMQTVTWCTDQEKTIQN